MTQQDKMCETSPVFLGQRGERLFRAFLMIFFRIRPMSFSGPFALAFSASVWNKSGALNSSSAPFDFH